MTVSKKSLSLSASVFAAVTAFSLTSTVVLAFPAAAQSQSPEVIVSAPARDVVRRQVHHSDLNLASHPGEKILLRRVDLAVKGMCRDIVGPGIVQWVVENGCRADAWDSARPQIRRAVHRARDIALNGKSSIATAAITISFKN
jgi:UrcA family protein